jgi:SH3-like domain-containing protein
MKKQRLFIALVIGSLMLACNLPTAASQLSPSETPLSPTETQPAVPPTETSLPVPTDTPTITPTPTPSVPMVTTKDKSVNCRFGPGQEYVPIGSGLAVGASTQILGKSIDGGWWLVQNPSGGNNCWVAGSVTVASGNLLGLLAVAAPLAYVTNVTIKADPAKIEVPGCVFPVSIGYQGTITVNGPVKVQWHWELSEGVSSPPDNINFTTFGSETLEDHYHVGAEGNYWVRLVVTSPNSMVAEAKYKAVCP